MDDVTRAGPDVVEIVCTNTVPIAEHSDKLTVLPIALFDAPNGPFVGQQLQTLRASGPSTPRPSPPPGGALGRRARAARSSEPSPQRPSCSPGAGSSSTSHADYFQRNKTAVRAERRLGLAVYRLGAFGRVAGL